MVDLYNDSGEIKETDIIFDCPNCQKSLAIDYRGAGLTIPCSDCGSYVAVPIPEGMEVTDLDSTDEEQETRILNLRRSLAAAESQIGELSSELQMITAEKEGLAKALKDVQRNFNEVMSSVTNVEHGHEQIRRALVKISETINETDEEA